MRRDAVKRRGDSDPERLRSNMPRAVEFIDNRYREIRRFHGERTGPPTEILVSVGLYDALVEELVGIRQGRLDGEPVRGLQLRGATITISSGHNDWRILGWQFGVGRDIVHDYMVAPAPLRVRQARFEPHPDNDMPRVAVAPVRARQPDPETEIVDVSFD